jgi:hypothetical protein
MTSHEFLKWLAQYSIDHWSYDTSFSSDSQVGAVQVERPEMKAELFKRPARNASRRSAAFRRSAPGPSRPTVNVA